MRVAILEAACAGLCGADSSLLREGAAMWRASVGDFARMPGVTVQTCLDERLRNELPLPSGVACFWSRQPAEWAAWWDEAVDESDRVLVIAPESGGMLQHLVVTGPKSLNCTPDAIALCADKLALAAHCEQNGIRTIPTTLVNWNSPPPSGFWVVKPRDGAGCCLTYVIADEAAWQRARSEYAATCTAAIQQPFVAGQPLSIAALVESPREPLLFPIGEQRIQRSSEGRLSYEGGRLPADVLPEARRNIGDLVRRLKDAITGLKGYVGCDVLLPHDPPHDPILVEINPRLTTSYVGYRQLCEQNLAGAMIGRLKDPLAWRPGEVRFRAEGTMESATAEA